MVFDDFIGITMTISQTELNQQLKSAGIGINATELHGFLSGLILWWTERPKLVTTFISIQ